MNKKQLVAKLAGSLNQSKADAERTFDTITNTILDALKNDDSVKIAGFGTYKVAKRKARIGRNTRRLFSNRNVFNPFFDVLCNYEWSKRFRSFLIITWRVSKKPINTGFICTQYIVLKTKLNTKKKLDFKGIL